MALTLVFLRHGVAEGKGSRKPDGERRLTPGGAAQVRRVATSPALQEDRFDLCLTSPLARARETAEAAAEVLGIRELRSTDGLLPDAEWPALRRALQALPGGSRVLLVGHEPSFGRFLAACAGLGCDSLVLEKAGAARVDVDTPARPGRLVWLLAPAAAEAMAGRPAPAVRPADRAPGPRVRPGESVLRVAGKAVAFHSERMLAHENEARRGRNPEALHDMRVAVRRMRAALQVFGDFAGSRERRGLSRDLRRTGRVLGEVRDFDVLLEHLRAHQSGLPARARPSLGPLLRALRNGRSAARRRMVEHLDSDRYARLKGRVRAFVVSSRSSKAWPPAPSAGMAAPAIIHPRLLEVRTRLEEALRAPPSPAELHKLRIAGKRLRYALEFLQDCLGPGGAQAVASLREVQDRLGALQDSIVAAEWMQAYLARSPPSSPAARAAGRYLATREREAESLLRDAVPLLRRSLGPGWLRGLRTALEAV